MRRLLILIAVFLMIVFNGIAFNVLDNSHSHGEDDKHVEDKANSHGIETEDKESHNEQKPEDNMTDHM